MSAHLSGMTKPPQTEICLLVIIDQGADTYYVFSDEDRPHAFLQTWVRQKWDAARHGVFDDPEECVTRYFEIETAASGKESDYHVEVCDLDPVI